MIRLPVAALLFVLMQAPLSAQDSEPEMAAKVLGQFVGNWELEMNQKPAKWTSSPGKRTVADNVVWILKNRFVATRGLDEANGGKSLWLLTHDPKAKVYRSWFFDNTGVLGGEWEGKWDEATKTFTMHATDTPQGWTSSAVMHFADAQPTKSFMWMKDETGTLLADCEFQRKRLPDGGGDRTLAAWSKIPDEAKIMAEMKTLAPLVGVYDAELVYEPSIWVPKQKRETRVSECQWILDGRCLQTFTKDSDGAETLFLLAYDPRMKAYRQWRFTPDGQVTKMSGQWDSTTDMLKLDTEMGKGLTFRITMSLAEPERTTWRGVVTDAEGQRYFHMDGQAKKRK